VLTEEDKQWISQRLEKVETALLTEFHKWASPVELRQKSHAAAIRALDTEVEAISERLKNLEGRVPGAPFLALFARSGDLRRHPTSPQQMRRRILFSPTDEHGREPGLVVSCRSKAPLLATNARNGAPEHPEHPKSGFDVFLKLSQRAAEFSPATKSNR